MEFTISHWSTRPTRTYWDYVRLRFPRREGASDHAPVIIELGE